MTASAGGPAVAGRQVGRHVLVTGAGTGIGRAIALRLAAEGAVLTLLARDLDRLQDTADEAAGLGASPRPRVASCDIRDPEALEKVVGAAAAAHGPVHAFVANSGIGGPNAAGPEDRFRAIIDTNLLGTYHSLRTAERHLASGPEPRQLVVTSSVLARLGVPGYTAYCASKAGVLGLVRALAAELAPRGVRVNAICPGWVNTSMARQGLEGFAAERGSSYDAVLEEAMRVVPLRRMSEPDEIAGTVAWLLSDDARGVTGQALDVNNGAVMG